MIIEKIKALELWKTFFINDDKIIMVIYILNLRLIGQRSNYT